MIDVKTLKQLIKLMKDNELTEIDIRDQEEQVLLKRGSAQAPVQMVAPQPVQPAAHAPAPPAAAPADAAPAETAAADDGLIEITSPMVGSFYSAPSPDAADFVSVGSTVSKDTVVCIVEAMKVFNEIKAEVSGTIQKVLVSNGDAIEFGQPLFLVKPN